MNPNEIERPAAQVFLYHELLARDGKRFYTDELPPANDGWVDTPAKFSDAKPDRVTPDPEVTEVRFKPTETWRYHRDLGAVRFWTNALPTQEEGWFDNPKDAGNWVAEGEEPTHESGVKALNARAFEDVDSFMEAFAQLNYTSDLTKAERTRMQKVGIQEYALAKLALELDQRKPVAVLAAEVRAAEEAEAERT